MGAKVFDYPPHPPGIISIPGFRPLRRRERLRGAGAPPLPHGDCLHAVRGAQQLSPTPRSLQPGITSHADYSTRGDGNPRAAEQTYRAFVARRASLDAWDVPGGGVPALQRVGVGAHRPRRRPAEQHPRAVHRFLGGSTRISRRRGGTPSSPMAMRICAYTCGWACVLCVGGWRCSTGWLAACLKLLASRCAVS